MNCKKSIQVLICAAGLILSFNCHAVQPMPNGVLIQWVPLPGDVSYMTWILPLRSTNWAYLGSTSNTNYLYTNAAPEGVMFGVSAVHKMTNGICCTSSDIGVAAWPPAIDASQNSVRLTPSGGYRVPTNQWLKVSSDLKSYDDWLRFKIVGTNVFVEHKASPLKPYLFMAYPTNPVPPMPGGAP